MKEMKDFSKLAEKTAIDKTIAALKENGISAISVKTAAEAKAKLLEILPEKAEVMQMTSVTLDEIGVTDDINKSGKYESIRNKLMSMNRDTDGIKMQKLGAAPEWTIGSVHAVTEDGKVIAVSNTGSQLPAYAYASGHVIWVVGAQKIVKNINEGMKRVYEYVLPLESERAKKAYGVPGSFNSKLLIINREVNPKRITMIIVDEKLGF